jgi:chaperonin GroEL
MAPRPHTTLVGGYAQPGTVEGRCAELRKQVSDATSDYDKEKLQERPAKLAGGVAVIRVGAPSETELKRRKEAFEDASSATKAAIAEGIVPGAGLALLHASGAVEAELAACEGDERTGVTIMLHARSGSTRPPADSSI